MSEKTDKQLEAEANEVGKNSHSLVSAILMMLGKRHGCEYGAVMHLVRCVDVEGQPDKTRISPLLSSTSNFPEGIDGFNIASTMTVEMFQEQMPDIVKAALTRVETLIASLEKGGAPTH